MTETDLPPDAPHRPRPAHLGRWVIYGFGLGAVITVVAAAFALITPLGEEMLPFLVPATEVLDPLSDEMGSWPGALTVGLTCLVNGVIYAAAAAGLGLVWQVVSRSGRGSAVRR